MTYDTPLSPGKSAGLVGIKVGKSQQGDSRCSSARSSCEFALRRVDTSPIIWYITALRNSVYDEKIRRLLSSFACLFSVNCVVLKFPALSLISSLCYLSFCWRF